ncbi:hypothetical protein VB711_16945 [Cronbergia sp. UHCC 0137]|uniref:hypothetical protein n=1 Tax=Cronbergia sp. UHCC 0137 TaxID=3110239 RepID=UPI002B1EDAB6|nr:hypothetical protein [Cronbergia sp. UHCC 0137]MEA5619514.1 hypothetical protein [Cronbergia sp. UHCC 0137]
MPLPEDFDSWTHLKDMVQKHHNKLVKKYFKNTPDDDISTAKGGIKKGCIIEDEDTVNYVLMRMWLFEITAGHAQSIQAPIYGMPVQEFQRDTKFNPQVYLYFSQTERNDDDDNSDVVTPAKGTITFKIKDETSATWTRAKSETLARQIKEEFATPPYIWKKGWFKCTYQDIEEGYDLRPLVFSRAEGVELVRKVLSIRNDVYNDDNFQFIAHDKVYSPNPGTHTVYGRVSKKPVKRPRIDVKFTHAQLHLYGRYKPVNLVAMQWTRLKEVIELVDY